MANSVVMYALGSRKIAVIKVVRELTGFGLKEAKELVEQDPPVTILANVSSDLAQDASTRLIAAGAAVEANAVEANAVTQYAVVMQAVGPRKINVIKVVRELTMLGLKEAKDLVESDPPVTILSKLPEEVADDASDRLIEAGAEVSVLQSLAESSIASDDDSLDDSGSGDDSPDSGPIPW